jgi:hypothetical protein
MKRAFLFVRVIYKFFQNDRFIQGRFCLRRPSGMSVNCSSFWRAYENCCFIHFLPADGGL